VLASDPAAAVDTRDLKPLTPDALLVKVRGIINERGQYGIRGLGRAFRIMDDRGDGKLDRYATGRATLAGSLLVVLPRVGCCVSARTSSGACTTTVST
jgi:hypothetical protein